MNCPHCGAEEVPQYWRNWSEWSCGTAGPTDAPHLMTIRAGCYDRQISQLKAELEQAKADRARAAMQERNKYLAKLSQCVRRDDPMLHGAVNSIDRAGRCSMSALAQAMLLGAKDKLQSIIEGK